MLLVLTDPALYLSDSVSLSFWRIFSVLVFVSMSPYFWLDLSSRLLSLYRSFCAICCEKKYGICRHLELKYCNCQSYCPLPPSNPSSSSRWKSIQSPPPLRPTNCRLSLNLVSAHHHAPTQPAQRIPKTLHLKNNKILTDFQKLFSARKEMKCSGKTELLHEIVHDSTWIRSRFFQFSCSIMN